MTERPSKLSFLRSRWTAVSAAVLISVAACGVALWLVVRILPSTENVAEVLALAGAAAILAGVAGGIGVGWVLGGSRRAAELARAPAVEAAKEPSAEEKLLGNIIDSMEGGVVTISSEGTITSANAVAQRTLGYESRDVVGRHFSAVFGDVAENRELRQMIAGALAARRTFSSVEAAAAASDGRRVALGLTISLLRGEGDRHRGIVLMFKDLARLTQLREQVRRTDQLASLGRLAAGMAHEIRNPLGSLHGLVELIQEDFAEDDPRRQYTGTILRTIDQLNALVESLLAFSHPPITHVEVLEAGDLVRECVQFCLFEERGRPVTLEEDYGGAPTRVRGDRDTIHGAIVNIVRNAFQATPDGGTVRIGVRRGLPPTPGEPEHIQITVANTGSYIAPEDREKLFTPFFTTKPSGTGLGLAIANQIITAHAGRIHLESELDSGTSFHIMLPVEAAGVTVPAEADV